MAGTDSPDAPERPLDSAAVAIPSTPDQVAERGNRPWRGVGRAGGHFQPAWCILLWVMNAEAYKGDSSSDRATGCTI